MAMLWFWLTEAVFTPMFKDIVQHDMAKFLMIRDSSSIPNVLFMEYVNSLRMNKQVSGHRLSLRAATGILVALARLKFRPLLLLLLRSLFYARLAVAVSPPPAPPLSL